VKRVKNRTKPRKSIVNETDGRVVEKLYIDFRRYPNWAHSVSRKKFTNALATKEEAAENFFFLLNEFFSDIEDNYREILANRWRHCHPLTGTQRSIAVDIVKNLQQIELGEDVNIWQLSAKHNQVDFAHLKLLPQDLWG